MDAKVQLFQWLARWEALVALKEGRSLIEIERSEAFDEFVKAPNGQRLDALVSSLKARSRGSKLLTGRFSRRADKSRRRYNASEVLERIVGHFWLEHRADRLGLLNREGTPPQIFYLCNTASRRALSLLRPAPADLAHVPFRHGMVRALSGLLCGQGAKDGVPPVPPEKIVVVFTDVAEELRRAVVPQLVSSFEYGKIPHLYLRVSPYLSSRLELKPTEGTEVIPVRHEDLLIKSPGEIRGRSVFNEKAGGGVLMLDFLDSHDWLHSGPSKWLPAYSGLIETVNSSFIRHEGSRLLIILSAEPNSYRKSWRMFSPFIGQLHIDQPNFAGLGMVPQLMNERQAAEIVGLGESDIRLIASRVPMVFDVLEGIGKKVRSLGYDSTDDAPILKAMERLPASNVVVASKKGGINSATKSERRLVPDAAMPLRGHFHFVISADGELGFIEEDVLAKSMRESSASGASPAIGNAEDGDLTPPGEPAGIVPAAVAPAVSERPFDQEVTEAMAKTIYEASRTLRSIEHSRITTPLSLIEALEESGLEIAAELCAAKRSPTHGYNRFSYLALTRAFLSGRGINREADRFERWAAARDLYDASPVLQSIGNEQLWPPRVLLESLVSMIPLIMKEQRKLHRRGFVEKDLSLRSLVTALASAERIDSNRISAINGLIKSYDIVSRSPTLKDIPEEDARSDEGVMRYLLTRRDRIAVEYLRSKGELRRDEFVFDGAENYFRLGTLFNALFSAGLLEESRCIRLTSSASGPMHFFIDNMAEVTRELRLQDRCRAAGEEAGCASFEHPRKPGETLSDIYVSHIFRWGRWFLGDRDVATRSIYRADEIAFMVLAGAGDVFDEAPREIIRRIEDAGWDAQVIPSTARRQSVTALSELLGFYEERELDGEPVREGRRQALEKVAKLVAWNSDAAVNGGKGGGGGAEVVRSSPVRPSGPDLSGALAMDGAYMCSQLSVGSYSTMALGAAAVHALAI